LEGKKSARRDIAVLNAAAALYVAGLTPSILEGIKKAEHSIDTGAARAKLAELVHATNP
jgi:anthranilate phosphoribosyltransferase